MWCEISRGPRVMEDVGSSRHADIRWLDLGQVWGTARPSSPGVNGNGRIGKALAPIARRLAGGHKVQQEAGSWTRASKSLEEIKPSFSAKVRSGPCVLHEPQE